MWAFFYWLVCFQVLVVGNPANTNCLIAAKSAPSIPKENFSCLTRLDHNRARSQVRVRVPAFHFVSRRVFTSISEFASRPLGGDSLRRSCYQCQEHDHLGQPLVHPVPRCAPLLGQHVRQWAPLLRCRQGWCLAQRRFHRCELIITIILHWCVSVQWFHSVLTVQLLML